MVVLVLLSALQSDCVAAFCLLFSVVPSSQHSNEEYSERKSSLIIQSCTQPRDMKLENELNSGKEKKVSGRGVVEFSLKTCGTSLLCFTYFLAASCLWTFMIPYTYMYIYMHQYLTILFWVYRHVGALMMPLSEFLECICSWSCTCMGV